MLSLYKLEIFATVVRAGSFSEAARQLPMTQPAVSQHIQDLENTLGTTLFVRGRRGVKLTSTGETLYDYTKRILRMVAEAESRVTNVENITLGQISIGATPGVSVYLMPDWIGTFRDRYPNLHVALQTKITQENVRAIMEHSIDLAVVEGEIDRSAQDGLAYMILRPVDLFVVVSKDHPWASREWIGVEQLHEQPFVARQTGSRTRIWVDEVLETYGVYPNIVGEFDNQEAIKRSVIANMGVTILPDYTMERERAEGQLHALTIADVPLRREIKLLWDQHLPFPPVARAFLLHLIQWFPQVGELPALKG